MNHGVYISENATGIIAPNESTAGLPVVIGTSPSGPLNEPQLVHRYEEAVDIFGQSDNWETHTLNEFIYSQFALYGQSPAVLIRVASNTPSAVIGGYDSSTGKSAGLELVGKIFHQFGIVPGIILCPGQSQNSEVAAVMRAKCDSLSGVFRCVCICDAEGTKYTDIPAKKNQVSSVNSQEILCWPKVKLGDKTYHLSTHICGVMTRADSQHDDVPYKSPSNEILQIDSCENGIMLSLDEANYLNAQGIVTALNWTGGWRSWGNRTSIYPSATDPKDSFIAVRRMFNFIGNTFINTLWQNVDEPMTVRVVRQIVSSFNLWLNGLTARGMILGGYIEYRPDENPKTALIDGKMKFHMYITPPVPAESIEGILEYDPANLETLIDAVNS